MLAAEAAGFQNMKFYHNRKIAAVIFPYELKQRILGRRGHLCNADCALLASKLVAGGAKSILLAHISEENNTPEIAFDEVAAAIGDDRINLATADQYAITRLVDEKEAVC